MFIPWPLQLFLTKSTTRLQLRIDRRNMSRGLKREGCCVEQVREQGTWNRC